MQTVSSMLCAPRWRRLGAMRWDAETWTAVSAPWWRELMAMMTGGRGILHEVRNQMEAIASVTKWQGRALAPAEVPGLVHEAFRQLGDGRPRPVEIEVPADVLQATGEVQLLQPARVERPAGDPDL